MSINKVILEHSHAHWFIYCLCMLLLYSAELSSRDRGCMSLKAKNIHPLVLYRESLPNPDLEELSGKDLKFIHNKEYIIHQWKLLKYIYLNVIGKHQIKRINQTNKTEEKTVIIILTTHYMQGPQLSISLNKIDSLLSIQQGYKTGLTILIL